jgi:hypothetical protein
VNRKRKQNVFFTIILFLMVLQMALMLSSCSPVKETINSSLPWNVAISKYELKDNLESIEVVTQYNGSKMDVEHHQAPMDGNVFLILEVAITKTGSESIPFEWKDLAVQDNSSNTFQRHANDSFLEQYNFTPRLTGLTLRFGENEGWICFEVPASAKKEKLTLNYTAPDGIVQQILIK